MQTQNNIPRYLEIGFALVAFLGFVLRIRGFEFGMYLLPVGLVGLGLFYIVQAFLPAQWQVSPSPYKFNFLSIFVYLVALVAMIGIMFKLLLFPYAAEILRYVLASFIVAIMFVLFQYRVSQQPIAILHYRYLLSRCVLIAATSFLFYITPYSKIAKLYYPKNPTYIEALEKYLAEPSNKNYQKKLSSEEQKL
jgi:hypothetical protein